MLWRYISQSLLSAFAAHSDAEVKTPWEEDNPRRLALPSHFYPAEAVYVNPCDGAKVGNFSAVCLVEGSGPGESEM